MPQLGLLGIVVIGTVIGNLLTHITEIAAATYAAKKYSDKIESEISSQQKDENTTDSSAQDTKSE